MSRFFAPRGRILPGPLKIQQPAERRSPVPVTPLALTSAAIAAGLLLLPQLSPRLSVDPTPMVELADAVRAEPQAPADARAEPAAAAAPALAVAPDRPAEAAAGLSEPAPQPAAPKPAQAAVRSPFQLDQLPALQADAADLDTAPDPAGLPPRAAPKPGPRRATGPNRGTAIVATGGPAQP